MAKKPGQLPIRAALMPEQIEIASYVGSAEHKVERWWGGLPAAYIGPDGQAHRPGKQLTTICPFTKAAQRDMATGWVRAALAAGQVRFYEGDKIFPARIWYRHTDGGHWIGFCTNGVLGQYKGWPVDEGECNALFG